MTLAQTEPALTVRGLTVAYNDTPAVMGVDATFPRGQISAIIGPNGAGKSTLLKASLGIIPKLSGDVAVFGMAVDQARERIAYVPQRASVDWDFPVNVIDVVQMGQYRRTGLLGRLTGLAHRAAMECLDQVGMADFAGRQIGQLSGGQQQRIFLARALAQEAELYLLDEPFAGVDAATERTIVEVLKTLRNAGKSVVAVHHDLATVPAYFDHVFLINTHRVAEGPVASAFTPDAVRMAYGAGLTFPAQALVQAAE